MKTETHDPIKIGHFIPCSGAAFWEKLTMYLLIPSGIALFICNIRVHLDKTNERSKIFDRLLITHFFTW